MRPRRAVQALAAALCALALAGCSTGLVVDTRHTAQGQDSRVLFVVLHYTDEGFEESLRILTRQQVSSHYLVSDESPPRIYRLVDEGRRAWHAGDSFWKGHGMLNASSIGIEIVNGGGRPQADGSMRFAPYPDAQIDAVIALVKDIVARHGIAPTRILGHSDIAPQRKIDPGAAFPWKRLAEAGLIPWPDADAVAARQAQHQAKLPDVAWFQQSLGALGYLVPLTGTLDEPTRRVIAAFQMKYRPARFDGQPDAETAALLDVVGALPR
ncbi:N-acetylmuramoyl-L-alanine amidase [Ideonella sp. A 288]|uniref:N-acetylmuramoyl-L-alanine amidase n=1 Tax=Ideonella sp. A 288 TaxID=1962181 RepID=UPI0018FE065F|nr:N-acetylmuramoyl-L-alanine amidase [Ideonella sp. A 288]